MNPQNQRASRSGEGCVLANRSHQLCHRAAVEKISVDQRQVCEEPRARNSAQAYIAAPKFGGVTVDSMACKFQTMQPRVKLYRIEVERLTLLSCRRSSIACSNQVQDTFIGEMIFSAKRSISSACGLIWRSSKSRPVAS